MARSTAWWPLALNYSKYEPWTTSRSNNEAAPRATCTLGPPAQGSPVGREDCEATTCVTFRSQDAAGRTSFVLRGVSRAIRRATGELLGQVRHLLAQSSHLTYQRLVHLSVV